MRISDWSSDVCSSDLPDVCGCGGFTEMKKIIAMAETAGIRLVPHVWGTAVVLAASLHVHAILPPSPPRHERYQPQFEFDRTLNPYRQAIVTQPIEPRDGILAVPAGPGPGLAIDRASLAQYSLENNRACPFPLKGDPRQ